MSPGLPDAGLDEISELPSLQIAHANTIDTINIDPKAAQKALANSQLTKEEIEKLAVKGGVFRQNTFA